MGNDRGRRSAGPDPNRRPTKAERKEQARLERGEIQAQMASRRRARTVALIVGVVVGAAVVGGAIWASGSSGPSDQAAASGELPGLLMTEAPWPANTEQLDERLDVLDLPPEGTAQHLHVPLFVFVDGEPVTVPTNLGVSLSAVSPLHTHDEQGTIHVESAQTRDFTLGQLFDVWGVRLTPECLGGHCAAGTARLRVFSGGEEVGGDPRDAVLEDTSAIVVTIGTEDDLPQPVPTGFPAGPPAD